MQGEKLYNLLMVIPDDRSMVGYKAPATSEEVRKAFSGWNVMSVIQEPSNPHHIPTPNNQQNPKVPGAVAGGA